MSREYPKNNSPENIASPTCGRIVWLLIRSEDRKEIMRGPYPAIVIAAHEDSLQIEALCAFMPDGPKNMENVYHRSQDESPTVICWDWMPYQKGQAAKNDELSKEIDAMKASHNK